MDRYENYHDSYGGEEEFRKANYSDMVNKYYDLATSFYDFGWGESFHFASRWKGESMRESIKTHEHFLALQLGLKPGMKVLDVGCGIGGPLREIARFSSISITGLNNEYQISRGTELNRLAGLTKSCEFVKADFMKTSFSDDTFNAVYAIEATSPAPDVVGCYKEIYRVLKPGQYFAVDEWCMTDHYNPNN
ncbi:cycloartenol-C-24-methyltransferase 1-like [Zingiber officinale]|uniref:cycloartenol-C-24-methyltransferase 1-like n=1 Tax=Zingiber officinale TaxID=94328 RepID=UPI001C4B9011|nr:cycloartenol-C-24-methyltransferase 1-like [Zingiber officinale]